MTDRYIGLTTKKHHTDPALQLIEKYPKLKEFFGENWLMEITKEGQNVYSVHPLVWELAAARNIFAESVIRIVEEVSGGLSAVKNLKKCPTFSDLIAAVREIETYSELRKKGYEVVWKPGFSGKRPDLLIKGDPPIYLEIFTITASDNDRAEQMARDKTLAEINKILPNPYLVSIHYKFPIIEENILDFVDFVREKIKTLRPSDLGIEFEYKHRGVVLAGVKFAISENRPGGVMSQMMGGMLNNSGRIKNRILDKLQNFQLPLKTDRMHLNGYLIFLESLFYDNYDVSTAVKGQETIRFVMRDGLPDNDADTIPGNASNGVIHSLSWNDLVSSNLDFIASTKSNNGRILASTDSLVLVSENLTAMQPEKLRVILFNPVS